ELLLMHVEHPEAARSGDWEEIRESAPWKPLQFNCTVASPWWEGSVELTAIRGLDFAEDPSRAYRVEKVDPIYDEGNRWEGERLTLVPHGSYRTSLKAG
ncbi:MAG: hypothetical protein R3257_07950, partial [bacterium]|nr:hypothetical protein [bacterium]